MTKIRIKLTRSENCVQYGVAPGSIVEIDLENEYLPIVLASEIYESDSRTPMEAKKAQAIAARTYLAAHLLAGTTIDDTTNYQAFKWKAVASIPNCVQACAETFGRVLMHGATLITAWYSASSGGRTKRSDEVWSAYKPWTASNLDPWDVAGREKWGEIKESHGVGMSQIGAAYAALAGYSCEQILEFYYPSTSIVSGYGEGGTESMATKTNLGLVEWARKWVGNPYWYGTFGQQASTSLLTSKTTQYPSHYTDARRARYEQDIRNKLNVFDCIGLMKGYVWLNDAGTIVYQSATDVNTSGLYSKSTVKGLLTSGLPEVPGLMMYKDGHVGVYEGNGNVIEAKGFAVGVVRSRVADTKWTHWIAVPWISYAGYEDKLRPQFDGPYTAKVVTQSSPLNIRDNPAASARSLAQVKKGDTLTVIGHADVIGWAKVQKDKVTGFSDAQYLLRIGEQIVPDVVDDVDDAETGAPPSTLDRPLYQATVINVKSGLNLRISPNLIDGNTIIYLPLGAMVDVFADNVGNGFALVQYGSLIGYCTRSYLLQTPGEVQVLYNIRADGVSRQVVEWIRAVYPGVIVSEA